VIDGAIVYGEAAAVDKRRVLRGAGTGHIAGYRRVRDRSRGIVGEVFDAAVHAPTYSLAMDTSRFNGVVGDRRVRDQ
jgi:hypothetical protein